MSTDAAMEPIDTTFECTIVPAEPTVDASRFQDKTIELLEDLPPNIADALEDADEALASLMEEHDFIEEIDDPVELAKKQRKALKKAKKAERRAQRQGSGDPTAGQKTCDMCGKSANLLIRCMYEEGQTDWKMVCGMCWKIASGGVVDGDKNHPHYRYGGLWKNRRAQS